MENNLVVIGLGNTLRRDDGIGIHLLRALRRKKIKGVDYLDFSTSSLDLVNRIDRYDAAILIDAIDAGLEAGKVKIFDLKDVACGLKEKAYSSHEMGLRYLSVLLNTLDIKTKIYVAGIQAEDTSYGDSVSEALNDNIPEMINEISKFVDATKRSMEVIV